MQIVIAQVAPGWKPRPIFAFGTIVGAVLGLLLRESIALGRGWLAPLLTLSHQVSPVLVVVFAVSWAWGHPQPRPFVRMVRVQDLLDCPAEATCSVLVDGFEYEEEGADFEDRYADESGDAAADEDLVFEFGGGSYER